MAQIIILSLLVLAFGWAVYRTLFKKGGSCCGGCDCCHGRCGEKSAAKTPSSVTRRTAKRTKSADS